MCEQNENEGENRCYSYQEVLNLPTRIENFAKISDQDLVNPVIEMKPLTEAKIKKKTGKHFSKQIFSIILESDWRKLFMHIRLLI